MSSTDSFSSNGSVNIVRGTRSQLIVFLFLNIWPSHLGLPILVAIIFFSKTVQRHPTFINLCFAFMIAGISSSLLVYSGNTEGPEPNKTYCLLQASLLYGYPAMASLSALALVFQMFMVIRSTFSGKEDPPSFTRRWSILILPYVVWFISIIATACVGAANPEKVSRNRRFFYCSVDADPLTNTITVFAALVLLVTFVLEIWTIYFFFKRWSAVKHDRAGVFTELNLSLRIMAFAAFLIIAMSLSLLSITSPASAVPDLVIASAPTVVILIFGTQLDILKAARVWRLWKHAPKKSTAHDNRAIMIDFTVSSTEGKTVWRSSESFAPRAMERF